MSQARALSSWAQCPCLRHGATAPRTCCCSPRRMGGRWMAATKGGLSRDAALHADRAMASSRLAAEALERVGRLEAVARFAVGRSPAGRRWFLAEVWWFRAEARWHLRDYEWQMSLHRYN
eukprot:4998014-Alexandrium_andersonii.AAC.1